MTQPSSQRRLHDGGLETTAFGGRYTLLRRLAVGGMAEIFLARQAAMAGFEKEIVIKRLRSELAGDPRIVEMFLDEARIGALLNHPNIVHVYDVDEHDGIPYIAMEYIIGEELNELCRRGIAHDKFLPLEHAVELIRQAAAGMGYFHARSSGEGAGAEPLEIVHLDISPSNLLVTQDGYLKIIDFGIATSRGQAASRGDVLPGKLGYMSPEQAARPVAVSGAGTARGRGRNPVDHRSDIFSLGIVLYEITVGKRLFRGPAQDVVKRLVEAQVEPPTFVRRSFPSSLEAIVMRALEKHPEDRYQSAYDLADDLEAFLRDARMHSGPVRIARYLDILTAAAGGERRPELVSESEQRGPTSDELDFDSQVFDGYSPVEGAPGPEQAPEWEDIEELDADVAAALGMELDELRALRTPVPDERAATSGSAIPRAAADKPIERDIPMDDLDAPTVDTGAPAANAPAIPVGPDAPTQITPPAAAPPLRPTPIPRPSIDSALPSGVLRAPAIQMPTERPVLDPSSMVRPVIGAGLLAARRTPSARPSGIAQRLPWIMVGALGVAVLVLVAYIVLT